MPTRLPRLALPALPALLLACVGPAPATSTDERRVIGGQPTPDGLYPGVGALWMDAFGGVLCSGTLIRPDVVLTAAHCLDPKVLGEDGLPGFTLAHDTVASPPPFVAGARAELHERFDIWSEPGPGVGEFFDIALLWLAEPITEVAPIALADPADGPALAPGLDVDLVGYGRTSNEGFDVGVKHHAVSTIVAVGPWELQISKGAGAPQNCHGDSGGPALVDLGDGVRVVGVVSRSAALEFDCDDGGIDTRVDAYRAWIDCKLAGDPECATPPPPPDAGVTPAPDAGDPPADGDGGGCCSVGAGGGAPAGGLVLGLAVLAGLRRRRPSRSGRE